MVALKITISLNPSLTMYSLISSENYLIFPPTMPLLIMKKVYFLSAEIKSSHGIVSWPGSPFSTVKESDITIGAMKSLVRYPTFFAYSLRIKRSAATKALIPADMHGITRVVSLNSATVADVPKTGTN